MSEDIVKAIDGLGHAFEELKKTNDSRLAELEKKGSADGLLEVKLENIHKAMDSYQDRMAKLEAAERVAEGVAEIKDSAKINHEYKNAFISYVTKGNQQSLDSLIETKALSVASDPNGGYLVTPVMSDRIIKKIFETSPLRQVANVQTISSDQLDFIVDNDEAAANWTTEQGTRSTTATPTFDKKSIFVHELYTKPKASQKLLDDASIDVETWLADKVAEKLRRTENTAFFTGDGVGKPRGLLTYTAGTSWGEIEQISSTSGTAATLDADDFISMYYSLKEDYQLNASFLMARSTVKKARLLKESTTDQYIWAPGLQAKAPDTILGAPVIQCSDMPVIATDSLSIAVGDFNKAYQIVDRAGIRMLRDPYSAKPFVEFYTTKRTGGDVTNFEAVKLLKMDA